MIRYITIVNAKLLGNLGDSFKKTQDNELMGLREKLMTLESSIKEKDKALEILKQQKAENQREIMFLRDQNQRVYLHDVSGDTAEQNRFESFGLK